MSTMGSEDRYEIFDKYADILEGYKPRLPKEKKSGAVYVVLITLVLVVLFCLAYIYLLPDRMFLNWDNQQIINTISKFFNNTLKIIKDYINIK